MNTNRHESEANKAQEWLLQRAKEITEFCLAKGGKCFADWPVKTLFAYVFFHLVDHGVFVCRQNGQIVAVMFAWATSVAAITQRHQQGLSPFNWERSRNHEDGGFLAEVIGERSLLPRLLKQVTAKWPDWKEKKIFTYRDGQLVELPKEVIGRMLQEGAKGAAGTKSGTRVHFHDHDRRAGKPSLHSQHAAVST